MTTSEPLSHSLRRRVRAMLIALVPIAATFALTGCQAGGTATAGNDPVVHRLRLTPCCEPAPSRPVVDVIAVGVSRSTDTRTIAEAQFEAFRESIVEFAQHGGRVRVVLFAGQGQTPPLLVDSTLPGPNSSDKTAYDADVSNLVGGSEQLVQQGLGLTPRSRAVAQLVREARTPIGSDDAGVLGYSLDFEAGSPLVHEVVLIDDGLQNGGGVWQGEMLTKPPSALVPNLARIVGVDGTGAYIRFAGLANSNVQDTTGGDRDRMLRLRAIWAAVCQRIHASCEATS